MSNLETIEIVLWRSSGRIFSTVSAVLRPDIQRVLDSE